MRRYGLFHPPVLAFFSKDLYVDVARNWRGTGILYLMLILTISWMLISMRLHMSVSNFAKTDGRKMAKEVPTFSITKGVAEFDVEQPFIVKDPNDAKKPILILDTTGEYSSLDDAPEAKLLVTQTQMFSRDANGTVKMVPLSQMPDMKVDQATLQTWIDLVAKWLAIAAFPFMLITSVMYRLMQLLVYALIGSAIASSFKLKMEFSTLMRVTAMAVTLVLVLDTIMWVAWVEIPTYWVLCILITIGYLYFGISAIAKAPQPPAPEPIEVQPVGAEPGSAPAPLAPAPHS